MPRTLTSSSFVQAVTKSGLVPDDVLQEALGPDAASLDTGAISERLVQKRLLTPYQAKQLLAGSIKGLVIGPYKVLSEIGRGGMGIVYLGEHLKLQRRVAIKTLPKEQTKDKLALERFYREARALAALDHENIVQAHDVNEWDGSHSLVMEYVPGVNLQTQVDEKGPIPWPTAVEYIKQACRGLQHAHQKGLVHRDIKPGNLLVDDKGTLKVLDLGLARCFRNAKDNLTGDLGDGSVLGSIDYISPEQALGDDKVDIRADIYSLGATFFTLITGKPPFEGSIAQKLTQHQLKAPPLLHDCRPEVPEDLSEVVARMMAKDPGDRYATPAQVIAALDLKPGTKKPQTAALEAWKGAGLARKKDAKTDSQRIEAPKPNLPLSSQKIATAARRETMPLKSSDTRVSTPAVPKRTPLSPEDEKRLRRERKQEAEDRRLRRAMLLVGLATGVVAVAGVAAVWLYLQPPKPGPTTTVASGPPQDLFRPAPAKSDPGGGSNPAAGQPPVQATGQPPVQATGTQPAAASPAWYVKVVHVETGKVIGVAGNPNTLRAPVLLADDSGNPVQEWQIERDGDYAKLINRESKLVMDVSESSKEPGAMIHLWRDKSRDNDNQRWVWEGDQTTGRLKSKHSGLVLDVTASGVVVQRAADPNSKTQLWMLVEAVKR
jgi:serine/threonine protein kinase